MQIHNLKPKTSRKKPKPKVGRGGKRGTTSGKGQKGQKSRAGRRIRPAVRDLLTRLPKLRGYDNNPKSQVSKAINLSELEKLGESTIKWKTLLDAKLIKRTEKNVKILSGGELKKAIIVVGIRVSKAATEKIEAAGGKIIK